MKTSGTKTLLFSYGMITVLFILLKLSLHFLTNTRYELLRDEMLFFNMGDHLSAGYATVPPVTGFLAFLMHKIFGFSVFGIRFFPAVMGAACMYIMSRIVRELGGGKVALVIALTSYVLAPGFLLTGMLFTPNSFEELIWLLVTWSIFRMVRTGNSRLWIVTGILLGIGFLNKYSVVFLVAGFIIALIASEKRKLLFTLNFFIGVCAGIIIILPNIIWQYNHNWPVLIHMSELKSSQLDLMGFTGFPVSLLAFSQGSILIWVIGLAGLFLKNEKQYRYAGIASMIILILMFGLKAKGYYALVLMPFLFSFGGYIIEKYLSGAFIRMRTAVFSLSVLISLSALPSGLPLLSFDNYSKYIQLTRHFILHPLLEWDNGTMHSFSQAYSDMTGWEELAGYVSDAYDLLNEAEKKNCTIIAERSYGYAGAVYFYGRRFGLPQPVTFHESYTYWAPDTIANGPVIYIYRDINGLDQLFADIRQVGSVDDKYFREKGLKVFLCKAPLKDITKIYKELAYKEKTRLGQVKKF